MKAERANVKVVTIIGPTAVGKTGLSVELCEALGGEIVSADSRQIYRHMDIGTAKATATEQARARHHLIDIVDPDQELTLAHYQKLALDCFDEISAQGKLPFLVGGTGLYVKATLEGWTVPQVPPNPDFRAEMESRAEEIGVDGLHQELAKVDPEAAAHIDARNVRRVIRALEVYQHTGRKMSEQQQKCPPPLDVLQIGLTRDRQTLYERIDLRIDRMIEIGLEAEVRGLLDRGYTPDLPAMSGLGYRQMIDAIQGKTTLDEAIALTKRHTRRFVRQQYNWFRLSDPAIHWYDASTIETQKLADEIQTFLNA